ncbi:GGDEF domain-containing protein [Longimycelium tulufanense]|nr:GGDEF domain-containing protein [Longimycelium tulufanense]
MAIDRLTGLLDRWGWDDAAPRALDHARRGGVGLALLLVDLDYFKRVNDEFGHVAGDAVLVHTARVLQQATRETDLVGRYGGHTGDEFLVLLTDIDPHQGLAIGEAIRDGISSAQIPARTSQGVVSVQGVTASIGIAFDDRAHEGDLTDLVLRADTALRAAKAHGRNNIQVARTSSFPGRKAWRTRSA